MKGLFVLFNLSVVSFSLVCAFTPNSNVIHSKSITSSSITSSLTRLHSSNHEIEKEEDDKFVLANNESKNNKNNKNKNNQQLSTRRSIFSKAAIATSALVSANTNIPLLNINNGPQPAHATITKDSTWNLWTALPVAPYSRRRTIKYNVGKNIWAFDQLIGIYYVHVPIRMTVVAVNQDENDDSDTNNEKRGLVVFAPIAPTKECMNLMQELIDTYGPVRDIILPSVAVEHKVNAGPFARQYPNANFYICDKQYSFPFNLPNSFLGLPSWTQPLPRSGAGTNGGGDKIFGKDIEHEVLTVKPGIGSMYQDVAMLHKPSKTLLVCDAIFAVNGDPPRILEEEEEYTRALLFHARDTKDEIVQDTTANRRKGWRRIVLLFNFFFPGSGRGDLGLGPIGQALQTPNYKNGWGGWMPFTWGEDEVKDFDRFSNGGKPTILPIIQIILSRGPDEIERWLNVVTKWDFNTVIPAHLDAPLYNVGPKEFEETFSFVKSGKNEVRFCDEDVEFLRKAEEGPLSFSVYKSSLGVLRGEPCDIQRPSKSKKN